MRDESESILTRQSADGLVMLDRPELVRRLDAASRRPLTTLIAPAGYGKTTLLRQWLDQSERDISYLNAEQINDGFVADDPELAPVVAIDDSHRLSQESLDAVVGLISSASHHVVLSGRHRLGSQLGSLAAAGLVSTIDAGELAFTTAETQAMLDAARPGAGSAEQEVLHLNGWPALVRIHCEYAGDESVGEFTWFGYFFDEQVLGGLCDTDLDFLTALAFLEDVTAPEATQLTGFSDAARRMARLHNVGLPLRWRHPAMDIHPMLRRHLLSRARLADPERAAQLAGRAVQVLEQRGHEPMAIALAYEWGDSQRAAEILRRRYFHLLYTKPARLLEQLERIRPDLADWEASMLVATVVAVLGQSAPDVALRTLRKQLGTDIDEGTRVRVAAHELLLARQCCYVDIDLSGVRRVAADLTAGRLEGAEGTPELAVFRLEYGLYLMHNGECAAPHEWLVAAITAARLTDLPAVVAQGYAAQSWLAGRDGNTEAVRRMAELAETIRDEHDLIVECVHLGWLARANNHLDRGEAEECLALLAKYRESSVFPRPDTMALAVGLQGFVGYAINEPGAVQAVRDFLADAPKMTGFHEYQILLALAACLGTAERFDELEGVVARLRERHRPIFGLLELYNGYTYLAEGRPEAAYELFQGLARSNRGRPKEQLHVLSQLSVAAAQLGLESIAEQTYAQAEDLASRLGLNPPGSAHLHTLEAPERIVEVNLTDAETKVLNHLADGLKVGELAAKMFISPNTVKTHLRKIYRKLKVNSKQAAVDRARALRLI